MKPMKKNRLKRRRRHGNVCAADSTDEDTKSPPARSHRKRKRKEADISEDIIDGFSIRCFKTYDMLIESKKNGIKYSVDDVVDENKEESPETSSLNPVEESYASSGSTVCGGYLGENENSELDEADKLSSKPPKKINVKSKHEDENFFCVVKTDGRLKDTFKEAESEPTDDDVILCPTPDPVPVKKKTPVSKPYVPVKTKQQPPPPATTLQNSSKIINNYENKELKRARQHVKVPPTMTVQPEQRRSNLVMPMIPVVKPTTSLVGPTSQPPFGPLRRNPQQLQPPLYPTLPPTITSHPGLLEQNYLQAELNSRFLQESQAERQRNGFHHPHHHHQLSHHSFNRVLPLPPSTYPQPHYYNSANYGAFHPKVHPAFPPHVVSQSSFHPQPHSILNVPQLTKDSPLPTPCKKHPKPGKWCALHVKIALMIQNHQKKQDKGEVIRSQKNKISSFYTPQQLSSSDGCRPETMSSVLSWRSRRHPIFAPPPADSQSSNFHRRHHNQMLQPMSSKQDQPSTGLFHHPHHLANTSRGNRSTLQPMTELSRAPAHMLATRYDFYPPSAISNGANAVAAAPNMLQPTNAIPSPFASPLLPNPATNSFYQNPYYLYGTGTMNSAGGFNNQPTTAQPHHPYGRPR